MAKNVGSGWLNLLVHLAVGFFLSPFVLHKLGDNAFGLWVLIFSLTGYYGLFDFGIRASIVRHVAKFAATHDEEQFARFCNTSVATYGFIALIALALTGVACLYLGSLFRIAPNLLRTAQLLLLMVGVEVSLGFPLGVFAGVLEGLQEFWWLNLTQIAFTLLRGLGIVVALGQGGGLLTIGLITVTLNLLGHAVCTVRACRTVPFRLGRKLVDREAFRQMVAYGSVTFAIIAAEKLRFQSDATVIGMFLSSAAITYYAVGLRLVEYPTAVVQSLAQVFTPMSSHCEAIGDVESLRRIFLAGNRACAMAIFPLCAILVILGKSIIELWVGARYVSSYTILLLLLLPKTLYLAQATSTKILLGMGRHQRLALVLLLEGGANLALSVLLLRHWGIVGVALGTAIPLTCTSLFFLPYHVCRLLGVSAGTFLKGAYLAPLVLCAPPVAVLLLMKRSFQAHTYGELVLQVGCAAALYGASLLWFFFTRERAGVEIWAGFARLWRRKSEVLTPP